MPTRFSSLSQSHTSGYADLQALQQLRGSAKKPRAQLQRKPRHLEPVQATNQQQHGVFASTGGCLQQSHLLDAEQPVISSKQLRSLVATAVVTETSRGTSDGVKYSAHQHPPQSQPHSVLGHGRSRQVDPVLSKLDALEDFGSSSTAPIATPASVSAQDRQQRTEEDCESPIRRKSHHVAHVRALQELQQSSHHKLASKPHTAALVQDTPVRMQYMDLSSMHGTTLARYRRLVGMVARKSLMQILQRASHNVAFCRLQHHCASRIQSVVRGFLQRRREVLRLRELSAVVIQCMWRSCQARSLVAVLLKSDRDRRMRLENLVAAREKQSATNIQRTYRAHLEWKLVGKRRAWACARLAVQWRSKRLRGQREAESVEQEFPGLVSEHEQLCGELHHSGSTQGQEASSMGDRPPGISLQPVICCKADEPFRHEAQELHGFESPRLENPPEPATEEFVITGRDQVRVHDTVHLPVSSISLVAQRTEAITSNIDQESYLTRDLNIRERCPPCATLQDESVGLTQHPSDSGGDNQGAAESSSRLSAAPCERTLPLPAPEPITDSLASSGEAAGSVSNSSKLGVLCSTSNSSSLGRRAAARLTSARKVLSRFLARWARRSLERTRREREMETRACVQIQCIVRQRLAAKRVRFVRQLAIRSLRAELESAWLSETSCSQSSQGEEDGDNDPSSDGDDGEEDEGPSLAASAATWSGITGCHAFLPTRNKAIPPGVQLHAMGLWKWSWSVEAWTAGS